MMFKPFENLRKALEDNQRAANSEPRRITEHKPLPPMIKRFVPQSLHK